MGKKSITLILLPLFLICSIGLQSTEFFIVQTYNDTDVNKLLTTATSWSNTTVTRCWAPGIDHAEREQRGKH